MSVCFDHMSIGSRVANNRPARVPGPAKERDRAPQVSAGSDAITGEKTVTSEADIRARAKLFFDAVEKGNIETVLDCYASDAEIWHNTDDKEQTRDDNADILKGFVERISDRVYANRRLHVFEGGFVQQHELRGKRRDGVAVRLTACVVCAIADGRITRLDEYFDSAQVAAFSNAARN